MEVCTSLRGRVLGRWIVALALMTFAGAAFLTTPAMVVAQDPEQAQPEGPKADDERPRMSSNPIVHFFTSIGVVFGIIFAALSVGTLALIIILIMDLRMGEAV